MKITWDSKAKAAYIYLDREDAKVDKTVQVSGHDVYLDYDKGHSLVGIEILHIETEPIVQKIG